MKTKINDFNILKRPGTDAMLKACWPHYDIVIWSQTGWRWIEAKLTELGLVTNPTYCINFIISENSMFRIVSENSSGEKRKHAVKPLELIWRKFPNYYSASNTIHIDDLRSNFALNPGEGLLIKAFRKAPQNRDDKELFLLTKYLMMLTKEDDFKKLDHSKWKDYINGKKG